MTVLLGNELSRRTFLKRSLQSGTALVIAFHLPEAQQAMAQSTEEFKPNGWLSIDRQGITTIICDKSEIGQGISDGFISVVADELGADLDKVVLGDVPTDPSSWIGRMGVSGSRSMRSAWKPLRVAGAQARTLLIQIAAARTGYPETDFSTEGGFVVHTSGSKIAFEELVEDAAKLIAPENPVLKDPSQFTIIGKKDPRKSIVKKVTGEARYALDTHIPDLLFASIERAPTFGATIKSVDETAARAIPGVLDIVKITSDARGTPKNGVGVVAKNYRAAVRGRAALKVEWASTENEQLNSADIAKELAAKIYEPTEAKETHGDFATSFAAASKQIAFDYAVPYLHHMPMEPMTCTADVRADECTVWAPTQQQGGAQTMAAQISGLDVKKVKLITPLIGGGFGRRLNNDYVAEAVTLSKAVGAPIKLIWSREDDVRNGGYRPIAACRIEAGLNAEGSMDSLRVALATPDRFSPPECIYTVPNLFTGMHKMAYPVPTGAWRSIHHSYNVFFMESFMDELAYAAGEDPLTFRLKHLPQDSLHRRVLEAVAEASQWGSALPDGRARGISVASPLADTYVAQVIEVSVEAGKVSVHKVTCAIDCGVAVSPSSVRAQAEGSIIWGLGAALLNEITIRAGAVVQSNFHDYPTLRMNEIPEIEVVILPSERDPGGMGEPCVPPVAPALTNAIFAATGQRVRQLPIKLV